MSSQQPPLTDPEGLSAYFTNVEYLQKIFLQAVTESILTKRLMIIHGVGGVGKSSLLSMFRLHCKNLHIPVALASGDENKSQQEILYSWAEDLKADGVELKNFAKTIKHYRSIQAKVDKQVLKTLDNHGKATIFAGKVTTKTTEAATGAAISAVVNSVLPGIGTLLGALGGAVIGTSAEELMDFLRGFLNKPDIDLLIDPTKKLTDDFLIDIAEIATKHRLVMMLDTIEQMSALDNWVLGIAQKLHSNVLMVISGRKMVNWDRLWPDWIAHTYAQPLEPMTSDAIRELVRRYYATQIGGEPDPMQIERIIHFSRGLPMAVTTAVRLWVKYSITDFEEVEAEALYELVRRLREGIPLGMIPFLEAAATVRYFNKEILRKVTAQSDVNVAYEELRCFPFVKSSKEGRLPVLRLHDSVREFIDRSLQVDDPERYIELHERAAVYFEKRLEKVIDEEAERLRLEQLYHKVQADEKVGIHMFQEMAEELMHYRLINRLRTLLNDVNTYPLIHMNSRLWREYYTAKLSDWSEAEKVYLAISVDEHAEAKLRAYALYDWGKSLRGRRIMKPEIVEKSISCFERSLEMGILDYKLASSLLELGNIYRDKGEWDKALAYLNQALNFYQEHNARYDLALTHIRFMWFFIYRGDWRQAFTTHARCLEIMHELQNPPSLQFDLFLGLPRIWIGRYAEAEESILKTFQLEKDLGISANWSFGNLAVALGASGKFDEAAVYFSKALERNRQSLNYTPRDETVTLGFYGAMLMRKGELDKAIEMLLQSVDIKRQIQDTSYLLDSINWLGVANEMSGNWLEAEKFYNQNLFEFRWTGRRYLECGALTGMVRVKYAMYDYDVILALLTEAEHLAQKYEYNDHLASLRLTQGHIVWDGHIPEWGKGFDIAMHYYQQTLIYALRYNRFLLDEILLGRPQGTPLKPIIPYCLERGEEGRRMLIALHDWWNTGINNIGMVRSDTISQIPENVALREAERIARNHEPGNKISQVTVIEQIVTALQEG